LIAKVSRVNKKLLNLKKKNLGVFLTGFTMIELLIAIAVFMIGIMAAFSLSLHNLNTTKENANRVIAANLAREGIETVRNIRDSNWLAREANISSNIIASNFIFLWRTGLNKNYFKVNYNEGNLVPFVSSDPISLDLAIGRDDAKLYINNGFYTHLDTGQPTVFRRAIKLQAICLLIQTEKPAEPKVCEYLTTNNTSLDCALAVTTPECATASTWILPKTKIGFQVTSRVQYTYGSRTNTIEAVEKIYNWRQ